MNRKEVLKNYIKFWLWMDIIASFPYTWVIALSRGIEYKAVEVNSEFDDDSAFSKTP